MCDIEPGMTIRNPADREQKYTFGKRGRRPAWVQEWLKAQGFEKSVTSRKEPKKDEEKVTEFQMWTYVNEGFMKDKMCIVARDLNHGVRVANPTFKYPFFRSELEGDNWKVEPYEGDLAPGIYQKDGAGEWMPRLAVKEILE